MPKFHIFFLLMVFFPMDYLSVLAAASPGAIDKIYINELMSSNKLFEDEFGETDDWVEIFNANNTAVDLKGLYLSDDLEQLDKWTISESVIIPAHGYIIFWLDGQIAQGTHHASFKLNSGGESLILSQMELGNIEILDQINFPEIPQNVSYGRRLDGMEPWVLFTEFSPLVSNAENDLFFESKITYSIASGHYANDTSLVLSSDDIDAEIRWTSDGSIPSNSSTLYTTPISLSETVLIRAAAFKTDHAPSGFSDNFYLINQNHEIPIVQISMDPNSIFDDEQGIYVSVPMDLKDALWTLTIGIKIGNGQHLYGCLMKMERSDLKSTLG